jgi:hypothetical protein
MSKYETNLNIQILNSKRDCLIILPERLSGSIKADGFGDGGFPFCHSREGVCCRTTLGVFEIATACKAGLAMTLKSRLSSLRGAKRRSNLLFGNKPEGGNPHYQLSETIPKPSASSGGALHLGLPHAMLFVIASEAKQSPLIYIRWYAITRLEKN